MDSNCEISRIEYDYSKLRGRIVEKFGTIAKFCEAVGTNYVAMSMKLNNKTGISRDEMANWGQHLDIDVDDYGTFFCTRKLN